MATSWKMRYSGEESESARLLFPVGAENKDIYVLVGDGTWKTLNTKNARAIVNRPLLKVGHLDEAKALGESGIVAVFEDIRTRLRADEIHFRREIISDMSAGEPLFLFNTAAADSGTTLPFVGEFLNYVVGYGAPHRTRKDVSDMWFHQWLSHGELRTLDEEGNAGQFQGQGSKSGNEFTISAPSYIFWLMVYKNEDALAEAKDILRRVGEDLGYWGSDNRQAGEAADAIRAAESEAVIRHAKLTLQADEGEGFTKKQTWEEQCILSNNMKKLAQFHRGDFTDYLQWHAYVDGSNAGEYFMPYQKVLLLDKDTADSVVNELTMVPGAGTFLNFKNNHYASLVPQLKLFAINYEGTPSDRAGVGSFTREPIIFPTNTQILDGVDVSVGRTDYGIKSFTWDLIGSNPRTKRNDIQAELVLYFQSFDQIFGAGANNNLIKLLKRVRPQKDINKRIAELREAEDNDVGSIDNADCRDTEEDALFEKAIGGFFELLAEVGWQTPVTDSLSSSQRAAAKSQKLNLILTLIDHEFVFNQDGTFLLKIAYRGRVEEALTIHAADALARYQDKVRRQVITAVKYYVGRENSEDNDESAAEKGKKIDEMLENYTDTFQTEALSSVLSDMDDKGRIFYGSIREEAFYQQALGGDKVRIVFGTGGFKLSRDIGEGDLPDLENFSQQFQGAGLGSMTNDELDVYIADREERVRQIEGGLRGVNGRITSGEGVCTERTDPPGELGSTQSVPRGQPSEDMWSEEGMPGQSRNASGRDASAGEPGSSQREQECQALRELKVSMEEKIAIIRAEIEEAELIRDSTSRDRHFMSFFFLADLIESLMMRVLNISQESTHETLIDLFLEDITKDGLITPTSKAKVKKEAYYAAEEYERIYTQLGTLQVVLGPLPLSTRGSCQTDIYNIGQIPISTKLFKEWFFKKVVDVDIDVYPIAHFIRDLLKDVAFKAIEDVCLVGEKTQLSFKSITFESPDVIRKNTLAGLIPDWDIHHSSNYCNVELLSNREMGDRSYSMLLIYAQNNSFKSLSGDELADARVGIHHLYFGKDRGIVKKINFTKNDIPGLREAKFARDILNPLAELSTRYNATATLIGSVIFWPGQQVFLNPMKLGSSIGRPQNRQSYANVLGLGGYYVISSVKCLIESGKFETSIDAIWTTSGAQARGSAISNIQKVLSHAELLADARAAGLTAVGTDLEHLIDAGSSGPWQLE